MSKLIELTKRMKPECLVVDGNGAVPWVMFLMTGTRFRHKKV